MRLSKNDFICSECGSIFSIQVTDTHLKKIYSTKQTWCYECKKITRHVNLIDSSLWKIKMENKFDKTDFESILLELMKKNERNRVFKKIL